MRNLYPTRAARPFLCLLVTVCIVISSQAQKIVTYDTTFGGWNAIVTEDVALQGTDSAAGIVFFPGIGEMTTKLSDLSVNGPHYLINNGLWDGSVTLGNGVHHPFIISLQPPSSGYSATVVMPKIQAILARYRIKRNSFYMTGLSCGGWQANEFVAYEATPSDNSYGRLVKAIVNLEGVEPADNTGIYLSEDYPRKMGHWAKACGGRELWVEGSQDWRDMQAGAQNMMDSVGGSASYFQVTYGGGAHCCWNSEYQPSVTWTKASNSNISQVTGAQIAMNVWQWLLRQGDTTMPAGESGSKAPAQSGAAPTVSAGKGQAITLPTNSTTLTGTAAGNGGATIVGLSWKQSSGPATAKLGSATSLSTAVTGMTVAGSYIFMFTATDNNGKTANGSVTVTVTGSGTATKPTVSAGSNLSVTLPASTATLNGVVSANGDVISGYNWMLMSGPGWVKFSNEWAVSTVVTGLVTGTYVFELSVTDSKGVVTNSSPVKVLVKAAGGTAMTAGLMTGHALGMGDSTGVADPSTAGQAAGLQLYPNPARDLLKIRVNNGTTGKLVVSIFDLRGTRVRSLQLDKESWSLQSSVDVSQLAAGVYLIEVQSGAQLSMTGKFIKQ